MAGHNKRRSPGGSWEPARASGAEDFRADEQQGFEILTEPANFKPVHKVLEAAGVRREIAGLASLPAITVSLADGNAVAVCDRLVDAWDEHDDVKEAFSTAEFSG